MKLPTARRTATRGVTSAVVEGSPAHRATTRRAVGHRIATRRAGSRDIVGAIGPLILALAAGMPAVVAAIVLLIAGLVAVHAP